MAKIDIQPMLINNFLRRFPTEAAEILNSTSEQEILSYLKNQPLDLITKGILAIFRGDYWYSRKTLSKYLRYQRSLMRLERKLCSELTAGEREVFLKIYSGACNKEIAEELCISFHAVKAHVLNISRKLNINNRFQTTLREAEFI